MAAQVGERASLTLAHRVTLNLTLTLSHRVTLSLTLTLSRRVTMDLTLAEAEGLGAGEIVLAEHLVVGVSLSERDLTLVLPLADVELELVRPKTPDGLSVSLSILGWDHGLDGLSLSR